MTLEDKARELTEAAHDIFLKHRFNVGDRPVRLGDVFLVVLVVTVGHAISGGKSK